MLIKAPYYEENDVVFLARDLLGKVLLTEIHGRITSGIIVETEAYKAPEDKASHAYNNRMTERTKTMFLSGGHAYIYLCYGIHEMFNVVTAQSGTAHAVLIRAVQPLTGAEFMRKRRNLPASDYRLTRGPGCVSKALGITRSYNACKLYDPQSPIRIYDDNIRYDKLQIACSKRIGVSYAEEAADWLFRFFVKENPYVCEER